MLESKLLYFYSHTLKIRKGKVKKGSGANPYGKLIQNDKFLLYRWINHGYTFFMIVKSFSMKILWFGSCAALLFLFPFALESMNE